MAKASIPVDLYNPGQVFACLGLVEAADVLLGAVEGGFDWQGPDEVQFFLAASGDEDPIKRVLRFLNEATVKSVAPVESANSTERWNVDTITVPAQSGKFPFPDPKSPATLPAHLEDAAGHVIEIDYWGDETQRDNVKFWAGSGGYPGSGLVRDALDLIRGCIEHGAGDPFAFAARQSSSFRFDWRRDYIPIDAGFSPNMHDDVAMQGHPVVELLAAIGMTHARPLRHSKLAYSYGVAGVTGSDLYAPIFLRAALGARQPLFPGMRFRRFHMQLDWPGQENMARCITNVTEEPLPCRSNSTTHS